MAMSKKDYVAIAAILREQGQCVHSTPGVIAFELADYFEKDNPRFDRARFLDAAISD